MTKRRRSYFPAANLQQSQTWIPGVGWTNQSLPSRSGRGGMTTIQLPGGGTTTVPASSAAAVYRGVPGSRTYNPAEQFDLAAAYKRGYGAPAPSVQGGNLVTGGVATPPELLTPQQRSQYGVQGTPFQRFADPFKTNPALTAGINLLGGFGSRIASWFSGARPSSAFASSANGAIPSPTPFQTPFPSATPTPTPRRYSDTPADYFNF